MITYSRIELPGGEELCYTTDSGIYLPEGLNVYDEGRRMWVLGITWDDHEQDWNRKHAHLVATKPILDRDPVLKQTEEKYVLKYKTVDKKVRPVPMVIPEGMKVKRTFPSDPLANLPVLPQNAPKFIPTGRVTAERMEKLEEDMSIELRKEEKRMLKYVIVLNGRSIAFDESERGTFRRDYFSDYQIPVVDHIPWMDKNIPLPKGYVDEIIRMLKEKISAGVYEES